MAPASRLAPGGGIRLSVTAPAHPAGGTPATGTPAVDAPAAGPGTGACPIFIARTSGCLVAWRICQTPVSFSGHAPNIIARRPGRPPGEAVLRGQPRAAARARHDRPRDAVPRAQRRSVAEAASRRLPGATGVPDMDQKERAAR